MTDTNGPSDFDVPAKLKPGQCRLMMSDVPLPRIADRDETISEARLRKDTPTSADKTPQHYRARCRPSAHPGV